MEIFQATVEEDSLTIHWTYGLLPWLHWALRYSRWAHRRAEALQPKADQRHSADQGDFDAIVEQ